MLVLMLTFGPAAAHIALELPGPVTTLMKRGPCGDGTHVRGDDPVVYEPGETITVRWVETTNHTSTFRISFDDDGDDSFADPQHTTDIYTNDTVLLDEIPDDPDQQYAVEVTLPDIECETCTLQLMQWMQDKPPYIPGTDDIYYQCADLALRALIPAPGDAGEEEVAQGEVTVDGGGCGCQQPGDAGAGLALAAVLLLLASRRRAARPRSAPITPPG